MESRSVDVVRPRSPKLFMSLRVALGFAPRPGSEQRACHLARHAAARAADRRNAAPVAACRGKDGRAGPRVEGSVRPSGRPRADAASHDAYAEGLAGG